MINDNIFRWVFMMFKQVSLVMSKFELTFDSCVDKCSPLDDAIQSYMCARGTLLHEKGRRLEPGAFNPVRVNTRSRSPSKLLLNFIGQQKGVERKSVIGLNDLVITLTGLKAPGTHIGFDNIVK